MFYRSNQTAKRYQAEFKDVVKRYNIGHVVHIGSTDLLSLGEGDIEAGLKEAKAAGADFALLILKKKNTPAYSACKDLTDQQFGFHSLYLTEDANWGTTKKPGLSGDVLGYFGNVAMKINLKMNGINHEVEHQENIYENTLVLGADVTHLSSGAILGCLLIAAIVDSIDTHGRYRGSMRLQDRDNKEASLSVLGISMNHH
jgi:hypothetical protein